MDNDPDTEKLDAMAARIRKADPKPLADVLDVDQKPLKMSSVGFDFLGAVLFCAFLGWLFDRALGTTPWGLLAMMLIGFAVGIMNVWRALNSSKSD